MKTILHKLEITWWNTHIQLIDKSKDAQESMPILRDLWAQKNQLIKPLFWAAALGFPLGVFLGALKHFQ